MMTATDIDRAMADHDLDEVFIKKRSKLMSSLTILP